MLMYTNDLPYFHFNCTTMEIKEGEYALWESMRRQLPHFKRLPPLILGTRKYMDKWLILTPYIWQSWKCVMGESSGSKLIHATGPQKESETRGGIWVGALGGGAERRMDSLFKEQLDPLHHSPNPYSQEQPSITPGHIRFTFWEAAIMVCVVIRHSRWLKFPSENRWMKRTSGLFHCLGYQAYLPQTGG